jgi:hypothetical protein
MTSQIATYGDMALVNTLSGAQTLTYASALTTWKPGDVFYSSTNNAFEAWNGSSWVNSSLPTARYIALLTGDPVAGGAVNISDAGFNELTTSGYARAAVTFNAANQNYPSSTSNNAVLTFTMTATMTVPVNWAALVTVASGTAGLFLASWTLAQSYQVAVSQSIQVGIGQLVLQGN